MIWPLLAVFAIAIATDAQELSVPPASPYVRVHGEAAISLLPDRAQLDIGIASQDASAKVATDANAKQSTMVTDRLRAAFPQATIKTINFSVNPNYRYPKEGGPPTILGYTANNTIRLDTSEVSAIQRIIDVAIQAGASNINRLNFSLSDEGAARAQALGKAAKQAEASAHALAASLGVRLGGVLRMEEVQPVVVSPAREIELSISKGQGTPASAVEPGSVEIHANVSITYSLLAR